MIAAAGAEHGILHKDPLCYSAHPHAIRLDSGEWLTVFNKSPRRRQILHPPQDPAFQNWLVRSADRGRSWSGPRVVPDKGWRGVECAGLTALGGRRVMLNQWRFHWYSLDEAKGRPDADHLTFPARLLAGLALSPEIETDPTLFAEPEKSAPWVRGGGDCYVHLSPDAGQAWTESHRIDIAPYSGGYGMRGAAALPDGTLLLALRDRKSVV